MIHFLIQGAVGRGATAEVAVGTLWSKGGVTFDMLPHALGDLGLTLYEPYNLCEEISLKCAHSPPLVCMWDSGSRHISSLCTVQDQTAAAFLTVGTTIQAGIRNLGMHILLESQAQ